jgi:hypothetical protein
VGAVQVTPGPSPPFSQVTVEPRSLACGWNGQSRLPVPVGGLVVKRNRPQRLSCSTAGATAVAHLELPRETVGEVKLQLDFFRDQSVKGRGELVVQAQDLDQVPLERLQLDVRTADGTVRVGPLRETLPAGRYQADVTYPETLKQVAFSVTAAGSPSVASGSFVLTDRPQAAAGVALSGAAPQVATRGPVVLDLGVLPSFAVSSGALGVGFGIAAELAIGARLGPGALLLSARPGYELYGVHCSASSTASSPSACVGGFGTTLSAFTAPILGMYRLESASGSRGGYLGVGPILGLSAGLAAGEPGHFKVGVAGVLGLQLRMAGRSYFFAEAQGRYLTRGAPAQDGALGWFTLAVGYRFEAL